MVTPSPSSQLASLRPDIKDAMVEFNMALNRARMIALTVFPVLEVQKQAGSYPKIKIEALLKLVETGRASGGGYQFAEFDFTDDNFSTKENGVTVPLDRRLQNVYSEFQMEVYTAGFARNIVMTNLERRVAALLHDTGTFTPTAVGDEWSDFVNARPAD